MHPLIYTLGLSLVALIAVQIVQQLPRAQQSIVFEQRHDLIRRTLIAVLGAQCHRFRGATPPARLRYDPAGDCTLPAGDTNLACHPSLSPVNLDLDGATLNIDFDTTGAYLRLDATGAPAQAQAMIAYFIAVHGWQSDGATGARRPANHAFTPGETPQALLWQAAGLDHHCGRARQPDPDSGILNGDNITWPAVPRAQALTDNLTDHCDPMTRAPCFRTANVPGSSARCHAVNRLPPSCNP